MTKRQTKREQWAKALDEIASPRRSEFAAQLRRTNRRVEKRKHRAN